MFGLSHRAKGAISVFLVIIYIFVFALMGVLVDGGRIRLAEAQAEEIQQLANESMLTYFHRALYEYYDLFGETKYTTEKMDSMITEMMREAMTASPQGSLESAMGASWMFSTDGKSYFDPYDLRLDDIKVGSNMNLANDEVFKSQINDAMKYSGPIILANNFLNIMSGMQEAQENMNAVNECSDAVSDVSDDISEYGDLLQKLQYRLRNYCKKPNEELSSAENKGNTSRQGVQKFSNKFDIDAEDILKDLLENKEKQEEKAKEQAEGDGTTAEGEQTETTEESEAPDDSEAVKKLLDATDVYVTTMMAVHSNAETLKDETDAAKAQGETLLAQVQAKQTELEGKSGTSGADASGVYSDFAEQMKNSADTIQECITALEDISIKLDGVIEPTPTTADFYKAVNDVSDKLVETYDYKTYKMERDETVNDYTYYLHGQFESIDNAADGLKCMEDNEEKLKEAEKKVKEDVNNSKNDDGDIPDSDRLGKVPASTEPDPSMQDFKQDSYDRKNASKKAGELSGTISNLTGTFLGNMAGALRDNLFECAYILSFFRDYVHTYKMPDSGIGQKGYDTVANDKFRNGDSYLDSKTYQAIETTCAEAEYVLFGDTNTKKDVAAAYTSIFGIRLALNYTSVFLTSELRSTVMEAASGAGIFAPVVIALLPFAFAVPRTVSDLNMLMNGRCTKLIYNKSNDWKETNTFTDGVVTGYSDYLMILLVMMNQDDKVNRMQDVIEMNVKKIDSAFTLQNALVNVYVQTDCSVKYAFMTQAFMPAQFRMDGRHTFSLATNVSY